MTNTPNAIETDEIEGLDENIDSRLGDYPIDTLRIRKETRTVFDVVRRIRANGFVLNPDFQRDFVWSLDKQSKLIESVVMRIPLPVLASVLLRCFQFWWRHCPLERMNCGS